MTIEDRLGIDLGGRLPVAEAVAWAGAHGVRHIDVQIDRELKALAAGGTAAADVAAQAAAAGVTLHLHTLSGMNVAEISPFLAEAASDYLAAYVDAAAALGSPTVVVHAGYHFTADYERRRRNGRRQAASC